MNNIKRYLGLIWILLGPLSAAYLVKTAIVEISTKPETNTIIQWLVITGVFLPIAAGLVLFGYYAFRGEYSKGE